MLSPHDEVITMQLNVFFSLQHTTRAFHVIESGRILASQRQSLRVECFFSCSSSDLTKSLNVEPDVQSSNRSRMPINVSRVAVRKSHQYLSNLYLIK